MIAKVRVVTAENRPARVWMRRHKMFIGLFDSCNSRVCKRA
jgi:hypothetical protein